MAYIAHGIIKCTPFLSVGHRDNTLFYGTISCLLIFLLNAVRLRLRLVLLYFAMFQCFCAFLNHLCWFAITSYPSIIYKN